MAISNRRIRSTRLLVVGLLLASLVTITLDARGGREGPLAVMGRVMGAVVGPLQEGVAAVFRPIGSWMTNVFRAGSLAEQNAALEEEINLLRRQIQEELALRRRVEELEQLLELRSQLGYETVGATVVAESVGNFEWSITIDRGAVDDVEVDMPVIAGEGLVGRVIEVYPFTSKVLLIIDPDSAVSARLASTGERGLIQGQREEPLRMELIDPETEVQPGEVVETSGYRLEEDLQGFYPSAIPIGVVDRVEPAEDEVTLEVLVRPNVDFSSLSTVLLVTEAEDEPATPASPSPSPSPSPSEARP
ncbi:MAG TPA: rod shape-determining protein MreC [Actinomycetota bacterium]|nr:rod shape-determining protein MreC [Actinomycetota bacterium]